MTEKGKRILQAAAVILCAAGVILAGKKKAVTPQEETVVVIIKETVEETPEKKEAEPPQTRIFTLCDVPLEDDFQIWLLELCGGDRDFYTLMVAMAEQESGFDPEAVGGEGELGMWQIKPETAKEAEEGIGRRLNLFDPQDNAEAAVFLMSGYMDKYGDSIKALMVYSMGETGARRCWKESVPKSKYAVSVLEKAAGYKERSRNVAVKDDV